MIKLHAKSTSFFRSLFHQIRINFRPHFRHPPDPPTCSKALFLHIQIAFRTSRKSHHFHLLLATQKSTKSVQKAHLLTLILHSKIQLKKLKTLISCSICSTSCRSAFSKISCFWPTFTSTFCMVFWPPPGTLWASFGRPLDPPNRPLTFKNDALAVVKT